MNIGGWLSDLWARIGAPIGASISADVAAVKAETVLIVADTGELQTDLVNGGRIDLLIDELTTQGDTNETAIGVVDGIVDNLLAGGGFGSGIVRKSITFAGATPNAIGDFDGTGNPAGIFTVTGQIIARIIAVCTTSLAFDVNATIAVGIVGATSTIIATTDLTVAALIAKEIWHDATPDSEIEAMSTMRDYIVTDGNDIILTCGVANTNTGVIEFYCLYTALSSDGAVVAA